MSTDTELNTMDDFDELRAARAEVEKQKAAVHAWVDEQSAACHLCRNGDAPAWPDYEAACKKLEAVRNRCGT